MLLAGPIGYGKSAVLKSLIYSLDSNLYFPIYVRGNSLSEAEQYNIILSALGQKPPFFPTASRRMFYKLIPELTKMPVIFLDDAQELKESALLALKAMVDFDTDSQHRITFILAGQQELKTILKYSKFLALKQHIRLFFPMQGMSLRETCAYIDHQTKTAGKPTSIFADDTKEKIHHFSNGIPRSINLTCYRSIVNAALNDINIIYPNNLFLDNLSD